MNRSDISELHQIALDHLDVLNGNPKPGWSGNIFENNLGGQLYSLGFDLDGGETFCAFYGHPAFIDAGEFREACNRRGDDLPALCSGIISRWRYYSHASFCVPDDGAYEWIRAALGRLLEIVEAAARWEKPADQIAREMVAMLRSMRDGAEVSASSLASLVTGRPLSFLEENLDLFDLLRRFEAEAVACGIDVDFSEWDGMAVGLPYNLPFVIGKPRS